MATERRSEQIDRSSMQSFLPSLVASDPCCTCRDEFSSLAVDRLVLSFSETPRLYAAPVVSIVAWTRCVDEAGLEEIC